MRTPRACTPTLVSPTPRAPVAHYWPDHRTVSSAPAASPATVHHASTRGYLALNELTHTAQVSVVVLRIKFQPKGQMEALHSYGTVVDIKLTQRRAWQASSGKNTGRTQQHSNELEFQQCMHFDYEPDQPAKQSPRHHNTHRRTDPSSPHNRHQQSCECASLLTSPSSSSSSSPPHHRHTTGPMHEQAASLRTQRLTRRRSVFPAWPPATVCGGVHGEPAAVHPPQP